MGNRKNIGGEEKDVSEKKIEPGSGKVRADPGSKNECYLVSEKFPLFKIILLADKNSDYPTFVDWVFIAL